MKVVGMSWDRGRAEMQALGAMLGPTSFTLDDGRDVQPLHVAPWQPAEAWQDPPILHRLRGEWPCIPFGAAPSGPLPPDWQAAAVSRPADAASAFPHGYGSNSEWHVEAVGDAALQAAITYPEDSAIEGLARRVEAIPGKAALRFTLSIRPRRDCRLPIGLHPVLALPPEPGGAILDPGPHGEVFSHPLDEGPGLSLLKPGEAYPSLSHLVARDGTVLDGTRLPFAQASENLLLLTGTQGMATLDNLDQRYRLRLEWDPVLFPSLMLWISNRGRRVPPWSGRHLALGVEPVRAAFDLGEAISAGDNPLSRAGIATAQSLRAGETLTTHYTISVEALP